MKYFYRFLKEHKGKALLALLLLLGQVAGTLLIPALIANVVDQGILRGNRAVVVTGGMQMLLVAVAGTGVAVWGSFATSDLGALFGYEMRSKLFRKVQQLSVSQMNELGVSSLITRSTSDITNLQQTLGMLLQMVVPAPIIVIVSMGMTALVNVRLAVIQLLFMAVLLIVAFAILRKSTGLSQMIQVRLDRINKVLLETVTGVRVIRAFGKEQYEEQRLGKVCEDYAVNMIRLNRLFAVFSPAVWLLIGGLMVVVLGVGGIFTLGGVMEVGQITAVTEYATLTMAYLMMAVAAMTTLPKARACLLRLEEVLDTSPAITDLGCCVTSYKTSNDVAAVEFGHVTFAYPGAEAAVISDLSFSIKQGQTTAVIGSTGSGKSTLADLLLRLHDVQAGSISIFGTDVREISQRELRERIGCVPQKAFLFSGTIADNLRMGDAKATDEMLWEALRVAQSSEFVKQLPLGLYAPVSQGGTNFSGGQRQRLAIARALVKRADILIFDDSFSALDVKTDALLRKALCHSAYKPAKLMIAQRVSSIIDAEQILVLDEGRLVGVGTHERLLNCCSVYRSIAKSQMNRREE